MYKIVEIEESKFVIYTKKFFWWKRLERQYKHFMIPIHFFSYEEAVQEVRKMADEAVRKQEEKKNKFKENTTYFNIYGKEYNPLYEHSDPAKNRSYTGHIPNEFRRDK